MAVRVIEDYWPAPAKINLFLHITGQREDGYHCLQTVFQFLKQHDRLYFSPRKDGRLTRQANYSPVDEQQDLVIRAARALQQHSTCGQGADIRIEKSLPVGGGLGGGSSNAATTLHALNALWGLGLSVDKLAGIGLSLGADVPVFVRGRAAWAEGVGEILRPIAPPERYYVIICPNCHVMTAQVFADPDLTRNTPPITICDFLSGKGHNDCEPVVRRAYAQVDQAMNWLARRAEARLTGTGACVFAGFNSQHKAEEVLTDLPEKWEGFVTRGLNTSPLLEKAAGCQHKTEQIDDGV